MLSILKVLSRKIHLKLHEFYSEGLNCEVFYIGGSDTLPPPLSKEEEDDILAMLDTDPEFAKKTLIDNGMVAESKEMCSKVYQCGSYSEALNVLGDYVNITSVDEDFEDETESVVMTV